MNNWISLISIFAGPIGAMVNKAIAAGSAAAIAYATAKGIPNEMAVSIVGSVVLALSTAISGFAASQGVQIPIINNDDTNGVKVVAATSSAPKVNGPIS